MFHSVSSLFIGLHNFSVLHRIPAFAAVIWSLLATEHVEIHHLHHV